MQESDLTALGHIGTVSDIASIVSYLASKESQFITGEGCARISSVKILTFFIIYQVNRSVLT